MSYVHNDRLYYFAGENVVQDFSSPKATTGTAERGDFGTGKSAFRRTMDTVDSENFTSPKTGQISLDLNSKAKTPMKEDESPEDLGEEFVQTLSDEYKRVRQIPPTDTKVLFEFWKQLRKAREKEKGNSSFARSSQGFNKAKDPNMTVSSNTSERLQNIRLVTQQREADVLYTLETRADELKREEKMKKYIMDTFRRQQSESQVDTKKKKVLTKETQERLYKRPESSIRKEKQPPEHPKDRECREFIAKLIEHYKSQRPNDKGYADPARLLEHWRSIPNKSELNLNVTEEQADEYINVYTDKKLQKVDELRKLKHGYYTDNPKELSAYYRKELKDEEKNKNDVEIDPALVDPMFETYCERKRLKRETEEKEKREADELKERIAKEFLKKKVLKGDVEKTDIKELAKPKDRLKVGKAIMNMTKMFPNDKILKKLLIQEFHEKKLAKYPEEYDIYDSEEEAEIKGRDLLKEPYKTAAAEKRQFLTLADLSRPQKKREKEIVEPFQSQLEKFATESQKRVDKEKQQEREYDKQHKLLERFILNSVREFLENRKKRLEENIPTLKEFLTKSYKEMKKAHPEATQQRFPHITYGYSKRLKNNSYPFEFKRYFFHLLKSVARGNKLHHGKKLLPFWAPPSSGASKHGLDRIVKATHNKRVYALSREVAINKIESKFDERTAWDKKAYLEERLNFMMTLSDAENCTFYPKTGSNIPLKYKQQIKDQYQSWAHEMLETKAGGFDEWVNRMGTDFLKRFPTIYKYGKFNRARLFLKRDLYIRAYKEIAESFNIASMKKHYEAPYDPEKEKNSMWSKENLKLEDKQMPQEDFDDEANTRFLDEVYSLIKFIEMKGKALKHEIGAFTHQLEHEMKKEKAQTQGAAGYGTVQLHKNDKIRTVMFPFRGDPLNASKYGAKSDDIAYRIFDLRFGQEVKARKKMLKTVIGNLNKQLEKDTEPKGWNPGGSKVIQRHSDRMEAYRKLAKKKYLALINNKNFNEKIKKLHANDEKLNKKLGLFRKANVFYSKEMYIDAFKTIVKAVEIVKLENEEKEEQESQKARIWRQKLALPPGTTVNYEQLLAPDIEDGADTRRSNGESATRSKLWVLAEKTGMLGGKPVDVNQFLNYQIEETYKKIERAIANQAKDIEILKNKMEKLENQQDDEDADVELLDRQITNLTKACEIRQVRIAEGKPPVAWQPTSAKEAILKIEEYDELTLRKQIAKNPEKAKKEMAKTDMLSSKFYEAEIDDIARMPFERHQ